jgi:hypothetical protein|uniref:Uncharacterized protein n=1 Tax=Acinetobacter phage vB_AbaSt_W16 TaxID=3116434 RepID=A0AB38ZCM4_9CAUD
MQIKKYVSSECDQSITIHGKGEVQVHSAFLNDVNGTPITAMGFIIKDGVPQEPVYHAKGCKKWCT